MLPRLRRRGHNSEKEYSHGSNEASHGDGPLEVSAEGRGIVMRIPTEGGGRLVIELSAQEAAELAEALGAAI